MIPPTIIVTGDKVKGYELKKFALQQLSILENLMSFQKLNEGFRTVKPFPGVVVECWSSFSTRVVSVHVGIGGAEELNEELKEKSFKCLCFPHFSTAEVMAVYPQYPEKNKDPDSGLEFSETEEQFLQRVTDYEDSLKTVRFAYDLAICANNSYVIFLDAKDANFGKYEVGQMVLATLADTLPDGTTDCERACLLDEERFKFLTISPISITGGIYKWLED